MVGRMMNKTFVKSPDAQPSYNYIDYAGGQGYITYYPITFQTSSTPTYSYALTTEQIDTTFGYTYLEGNMDIDFDLLFNNPATINGTAYVSFSYTSGAGADATITITLSKVRGGVETSIVSKEIVNSSADSVIRRYTADLIVPKTDFSSGDTLRMTYVLSNGGGTVRVYADPASRLSLTETTSGRTIGTDFKLVLPFKIDL